MTGEESSEISLLESVLNRYLSSKAKGADSSGAYRQTAETALTQWQEWLQEQDYDRVNDLGDQEKGATIMRRYAQCLRQRVQENDIAPSTARTY